MLFHSYTFIFLFLPLALVTYFKLGQLGRSRSALLALVLASLFFYGWWHPQYLWLITGSIVFNFLMGKQIGKHDSQLNRAARKRWLYLGVIGNLIPLIYYKQLLFLLSASGTTFSLAFSTTPGIYIPLAISFFTFQQIAYLVDVYRHQDPEQEWVPYSLFVIFFPQLIAGPIVHHNEVIPQFQNQNACKLQKENLAVGLSIFSMGLFKKVVIADGLSLYADPMYMAVGTGYSVTFIEAWGGVLAFAFQLYFDFSGYSDMAVGLARMININLPLNFNSPYKAVNRFDYWRRWHMTLLRFMRLHVYFPLSRKKKGRFVKHMAMIITVVLGGLWHGAGITFVFWGLCHGVLMLLNNAWHRIKRGMGHDLSQTTLRGIVISVAFNFFFSCLLSVLFRSGNMQEVWIILKGMFGANGWILPTPFAPHSPDAIKFFEQLGIHFGATQVFGGKTQILCLGLVMIVVWACPNTRELMGRYDTTINPLGHENDVLNPGPWSNKVLGFLKFEFSVRWALFIALLNVGSIFSMAQVQRFIYYQF